MILSAGRGLTGIAAAAVVLFSALQAEVEWLGVDALENPKWLKAPEETMVVVFSAKWCGPCRKMAATTLVHPKMNTFDKNIAWMEVDIDENQILAAKYRIRGVPAVVVVDREGRVQGQKFGFIEIDELVAFMAQTKKTAEAAADWGGPDFDWEDEKAVEALVIKAVTKMSDPAEGERDMMLLGLARMGEIAYRPLFKLLADDRLRVRSSASEVLRMISRSKKPFDPFAEKSVRDEQAKMWAGSVLEGREVE